MSVLIINYHRTEADRSRADGHVISDDEFATQLNAIKRSSIHVISAEELGKPSIWKSCKQVSITFDDGSKSDLRNAYLLRRFGWTATFFISTSNIGKPGYLDAKEILELQDLGMVIGSHSHEHRRMTKMSPEEVDCNIAQSKDILETILNRKLDRFAFPGGAYSSSILEKLQSHGFLHVFGTAWGSNDPGAALDNYVYRRNNVVHQIPVSDFNDIISQKRYLRRQAKFFFRTAALNLLPEQTYGRLRRLLSPRA